MKMTSEKNETSPSFYLMDEYNLLLSEGEYDKFIEAFKKQLLEREKYEFLHELDLGVKKQEEEYTGNMKHGAGSRSRNMANYTRLLDK